MYVLRKYEYLYVCMYVRITYVCMSVYMHFGMYAIMYYVYV